MPIRQSTPEKDDVAFVYGGAYLYFYNNRFYRAYYSSDFKGDILKGLKIGSFKSELIKNFGEKYDFEQDGLVWHRPGYLVIAKMNDRNRLLGLWFIKEDVK
jgi:hypothetical protein